MKIGLQLPVFSGDGVAIRDFAVAAESLGYDSVWTGDHYVIPATIEAPYPYAWRFAGDLDDLFPVKAFLEAIALCGFVAGATERLQIGVGVFVLPMRNPVALAKELATLDVLSGGRVIAGVGAGWLAEEFHALGASYDERGARTDEWIEILRSLWSPDQPVAHDGRFHRFGPVHCEPVPVTPGGPPIWVGGHTAAALRRCARVGVGWHAIELSPADFAAASTRLDELLVDAGRAPREVVRTVATRLRLGGDDVTAAIETVAAYEDAGCDHLVVVSTASRSVAENIGRAQRLRDALATVAA